jgi:AcrR family transcriptional regulator
VPSSGSELPLVDAPGPDERADAARNRERILHAAAGVFAAHPPGKVTMNDLALAAGVGRATLYRRYPSVGAVAEALLDEHERQLQAGILSGPPPLGPGASPSERLAAFYAAMVTLLDQHAHLVLGAEIGQERYRTGAYEFWRAHVHHLLSEGGAPDVDALCDLVLAPLDPSVYLHLRDRQIGTDRIQGALAFLAQAALGPR